MRKAAWALPLHAALTNENPVNMRELGECMIDHPHSLLYCYGKNKTNFSRSNEKNVLQKCLHSQT
jgi:hypothetical protein